MTTSPAVSLVLAATVGLAALLSVWDAAYARTGEDVSPPAVEAAAAPTDGLAEPRAPEPVGVRSDAVDIASPTIPVGKRDDGRLEVPEDAHTAGWWTGRAIPGERGPAVIVGHVDSREGPGAFWELGDLEAQDRVSVDREDGTSLHWRVARVERYPKEDFPTRAVYGHTDTPTLRLVTCSGFFDAEVGHYEDNTIVFLTLAEEQDPAVERARSSDGHRIPAAAARRRDPPLGLLTAATTAVDGRATGGRGWPVRPRATAVEPSGGGQARRLPIALAVGSLAAASGAVYREWALRR